MSPTSRNKEIQEAGVQETVRLRRVEYRRQGGKAEYRKQIGRVEHRKQGGSLV